MDEVVAADVVVVVLAAVTVDLNVVSGFMVVVVVYKGVEATANSPSDSDSMDRPCTDLGVKHVISCLSIISTDVTFSQFLSQRILVSQCHLVDDMWSVVS